ncbi:hypothetical protein PRJ39_25035 [Lysobacter enzymogenes]|uniref:hypothetical protein n=1 Tax=Lysobacter enzymogenes TaxID=69 RepID=UPI003748BBA8
MRRRVILQDRYPNRDGIYTKLRELTASDLDAQIRVLQELAVQHEEHVQALIAYRDRVFDKSRHGR